MSRRPACRCVKRRTPRPFRGQIIAVPAFGRLPDLVHFHRVSKTRVDARRRRRPHDRTSLKSSCNDIIHYSCCGSSDDDEVDQDETRPVDRQTGCFGRSSCRNHSQRTNCDYVMECVLIHKNISFNQTS